MVTMLIKKKGPLVIRDLTERQPDPASPRAEASPERRLRAFDSGMARKPQTAQTAARAPTTKNGAR